VLIVSSMTCPAQCRHCCFDQIDREACCSALSAVLEV
jgi:hypothetical protein